MAEDKQPLFTFEPSPTFNVPVQLTAPGGEKRTLNVTFRHMAKSRLAEWRKTVEARPADEEIDVLCEIMADWQADTPFSRDALVVLLDNHYRAGEELYMAFLAGLAGARLGN